MIYNSNRKKHVSQPTESYFYQLLALAFSMLLMISFFWPTLDCQWRASVTSSLTWEPSWCLDESDKGTKMRREDFCFWCQARHKTGLRAESYSWDFDFMMLMWCTDWALGCDADGRGRNFSIQRMINLKWMNWTEVWSSGKIASSFASLNFYLLKRTTHWTDHDLEIHID